MSIRITPPVGAALGAIATAGFLILSSCDSSAGSASDNRGWGDSGIASRDDGKTHIVNQPDLFGNVSIKCDGKYGYMIFMPTHTLSDVPPVVTPDPRCPGYRKDLVAPGQPAAGGAPRPVEE